MNIIRRIETYINRTKFMDAGAVCRYSLDHNEITALYEKAESGDIWTAVVLAFKYGQAKGYRLAKKEAAHV